MSEVEPIGYVCHRPFWIGLWKCLAPQLAPVPQRCLTLFKPQLSSHLPADIPSQLLGALIEAKNLSAFLQIERFNLGIPWLAYQQGPLS